VKLLYIALPLGAYLYGSVPFGYLLARLLKGVDIRTVGSGNIGATNAARVLGFKFFPLVFVLDTSKGLLPALAGAALTPADSPYSPPPLAVAAAVAAIAGHVFPLFLRFKGGKAVAAGAGAFLVLNPVALAVAAAVWGVVFALWRYVSLASITAAASLACASWFLTGDPAGSGRYGTAFATAGAATVILLHHANIRRLLSGTEHRIGGGTPGKGPSP